MKIAGTPTLEEKSRNKPGYLSPQFRPRCRQCNKVLPIYPYWNHKDKVTYGYRGHNAFCTLGCGYCFGLQAAQKGE